MDPSFWKRCSSCKEPIGFGAAYYACNVTTCNRPRTGLVFCSVSCWDVHVPIYRHRDAWAEDKAAPSLAEWRREQEASEPPRAEPRPASTGVARPVLRSVPKTTDAPAAQARSEMSDRELPHDVLVVASKLKAYIRAKSDMNTSDGVLEVLSDRLRALCDQAIERAREAGRKTVLDRDF